MRRCAKRSAAGCSCVTITMVMPSDSLISRSRCMISSPVALSRLPVGSSASRIVGRLTRARARAARCCSPPESSLGRCVRRAPRRDAIDGFADAGGALAAIDFGEAQRKLDVFFERHAREQIEGLEDDADGLAAMARQFSGAHFARLRSLRR